MRAKTFIKLNDSDYRDRVHACWIGKNIGGTMGAPYEGKREMQNITGFASEPGRALPNDDLDLQLIWLHATEQLGPLAINAATLGEFWLTQIPANWNEYGIGKNNMKRGLMPPVSGDYQNKWQNSNGAWIRTEVWACMAPGAPALAAKYAMEDAKVDHGSGEGTVAAAFVAAMQSAAFVIHDLKTCIELGLSAIPEESRMADSIRFLLSLRDEGVAAMDARNAILERNSDIGDGWFEAPSNVAYAVIGLLWGDGDFKKSMITAINCGDDTDCTGATVGATMGILGGTAVIPKDWSEYIGDDIITIAVNRTDLGAGASVPKTCTQLSERVIAMAPHVLFDNQAAVEFTDSADDIPSDVKELLLKQCEAMRKTNSLVPYSMRVTSPVLYADVLLDSAPDIAPFEEKTLTVNVRIERSLGDECCNLECRWWLPEGFTMESGRLTGTILTKNKYNTGYAPFTFKLKAGERVSAVNRCVLEVMPIGRCTPLYIPVTFLG